jgi:hypothetical protein
MIRRLALVKTDVSEDRSVTIVRVTIIGEIGTTLNSLPFHSRPEVLFLEFLLHELQPIIALHQVAMMGVVLSR